MATNNGELVQKLTKVVIDIEKIKDSVADVTDVTTYRELQAMCKSRGLPSSGKAEVLRERLAASKTADKPATKLADKPATKPADKPVQATYRELQAMCKSRGLPATGKAEVLRQHLGMPEP